MEIARTIAGCRGHMVMGDERSSERANGLLHLGRGCRIGQDGENVGARSALSLELCRGLCRGRGSLFRQPRRWIERLPVRGRCCLCFLGRSVDRTGESPGGGLPRPWRFPT